MERKRKWCLKGEKVLLVPYSTHHVNKYHQWMQDPVLRSQTASEPLSLEQEHEMQQSWLRDDDKCTFIVLSREAYDRGTSEIDCMVGDVNMFLTKEVEEGDEKGGSSSYHSAEIEIMIAEPLYRGQGLGLEATKLMMGHGIVELGLDRFRAKISTDNVPSLKLFQEKLNFIKVSRSEVFKEVTLELNIVAEVGKSYAEYLRSHSQWHTYEPNLTTS